MASDEVDIGLRIKRRREELGISLRELARRTELTASFVSQVERGLANPSIGSLRRMAEALDVSMVYFLYEQPSVDPVVQANQRPKVTLTDPELTYEVLTPQMNHKMEAIQACIVNGQENFARPLREPTEEFIYILEGRLRVVLESGEYLLSPGDSIYFEGTTLREISNGHNGETRWISVITPPVF